MLYAFVPLAREEYGKVSMERGERFVVVESGKLGGWAKTGRFSGPKPGPRDRAEL